MGVIKLIFLVPILVTILGTILGAIMDKGHHGVQIIFQQKIKTGVGYPRC